MAEQKPRRAIELLRDWGERSKGALLEVLRPGENPVRSCVDPVRAAVMVERGEARGHEAELSPASPAKAKPKRRKVKTDG